MLFAWVALLRYFQIPSILGDDSTEIEILDWCGDIEQRARKDDKLVFFFLDDLLAIPNDPELKSTLNEYFLVVRLDSKAYPSDSKILHKIFTASATNGTLKAGILSPTLNPIVLTSKDFYDNSKNNSLKAVLYSSLDFYKNNRNEIYKSATYLKDNLNLIKEKDRIASSQICFDNITLVQLAGNQLDLRKVFSDYLKANASIALLTENARLLYRSTSSVLVRCIDNISDTNTLSFLAYKLYSNLTKDNERPLIVRAFAEAAICVNNKQAKTLSIKSAAMLLEDFNAEDKLFFESQNYPVDANSVAISALCYVYKLSNNKLYLNVAKICADRLYTIFKANRILPELAVPKNSEAQANTYAFLARALMDLYILTKDEIYLSQTNEVLQKLDRFYLSEYKFLYYDNSKSSPLAKVTRIFDIIDSDNFPSATGTVAQIYADFNALKIPTPTGFKLEEFVSEHLSIMPMNNLSKPTIKLVMFRNPLLY